MTFSEETLFWYCLVTLYILGFVVFILHRFTQAPYGKHYRLGWGPTVSPTAAWVFFESPTLWLTLLLFPFGQHATNSRSLILMAPYLFHYFHRTCIYPFRLNRPAVSHGFPVTVAMMAFGFNLLNVYLQAREVSHYRVYNDDNWFWPRVLVGSLIFLWGMQINIYSDLALIRLKEESKEYKVPRGRWFELVSCPNYFGELMEWLGWSVMTWSPVSFGFFFFSCANLVPRAHSHHKWYLKKFRDYPKDRKVIIPFLY